jgi:transposase
MNRRQEVLSVVERRRRWTAEEKLKVLLALQEPGATVSAVADRHGVSRPLVYYWRRLARTGQMPGVSVTGVASGGFCPVHISDDAPTPQLCAPQSEPRLARIEVVLRNGRLLRVDVSVDPAVVARLASALDGTLL